MQKVEGSSPFIRSQKAPLRRLLHKALERGFLLAVVAALARES
jgi:hypothetical protein